MHVCKLYTRFQSLHRHLKYRVVYIVSIFVKDILSSSKLISEHTSYLLTTYLKVKSCQASYFPTPWKATPYALSPRRLGLAFTLDHKEMQLDLLFLRRKILSLLFPQRSERHKTCQALLDLEDYDFLPQKLLVLREQREVGNANFRDQRATKLIILVQKGKKKKKKVIVTYSTPSEVCLPTKKKKEKKKRHIWKENLQWLRNRPATILFQSKRILSQLSVIEKMQR